MATPDESSWPEQTRTLHQTAKMILIGWGVVAVGLAVFGFLDSRGTDGWGDLIGIIYIMMAMIALVVIGLTALLIRRFASTPNSQMLAAALVPPVGVVLGVFVLGAL